MECFANGSREAELDRTAEMFLDLCKNGRPQNALWLVYDTNRFDAKSFKFLCERVQARNMKKKRGLNDGTKKIYYLNERREKKRNGDPSGS